jgi:hypothetical protein
MKSAGTVIVDTWRITAVRAAQSAAPASQLMEHRWGQRRRCRARVCVSGGAGVGGTARVRDLSISGAFLETALPLQLYSQIALAVLRDDGSKHLFEFTAAVVRTTPDGVGIEWCEPVAGSVCQLLGCALECGAARE